MMRDADRGFLSGLILEQFPAGNKAIKREMRKTEDGADDPGVRHQQ
jgi:hypothetical protein